MERYRYLRSVKAYAAMTGSATGWLDRGRYHRLSPAARGWIGDRAVPPTPAPMVDLEVPTTGACSANRGQGARKRRNGSDAYCPTLVG